MLKKIFITTLTLLITQNIYCAVKEKVIEAQCKDLKDNQADKIAQKIGDIKLGFMTVNKLGYDLNKIVKNVITDVCPKAIASLEQVANDKNCSVLKREITPLAIDSLKKQGGAFKLAGTLKGTINDKFDQNCNKIVDYANKLAQKS